MSFKTILNVLGEHESAEDLETAMKLGGEVSAHLSALLVAMAPVPTGRYQTLSPSWLEVRERNLQQLSERIVKIRERLATAELSFDVDSIYAEVAGPPTTSAKEPSTRIWSWPARGLRERRLEVAGSQRWAFPSGTARLVRPS